MHYISNNILSFKPNEIKLLESILKLKLKPKAMKKMPLALVIFCTFTLLSFNACSPGYGCFYSATETIPDQVEKSAIPTEVDQANVFLEEINCLP